MCFLSRAAACTLRSILVVNWTDCSQRVTSSRDCGQASRNQQRALAWKRLNSPLSMPSVVLCPWLSPAPTMAPCSRAVQRQEELAAWAQQAGAQQQRSGRAGAGGWSSPVAAAAGRAALALPGRIHSNTTSATHRTAAQRTMWIMGPSGPTGRPDPTAVAADRNLTTNVRILRICGGRNLDAEVVSASINMQAMLATGGNLTTNARVLRMCGEQASLQHACKYA